MGCWLARRLGQGLQPGRSVGTVKECLGQVFQDLGVVDPVEQGGALLGHRGAEPFAGLPQQEQALALQSLLDPLLDPCWIPCWIPLRMPIRSTLVT